MAKAKATIVAGALYASKGEDGCWRVVKVLASNKSTVFLRLYRNRFPKCPRKVDPTTLTLAMSLADLDRDVVPIGVGCMPVSVKGFMNEKNHFLGHAPVTREELEDLDF